MSFLLRKNIVNSCLLAFYIWAISLYYLIASLRIASFLIFALIFFIAIYKLKKVIFKRNVILLLWSYFFFSIVVQIINSSLSHFSLFLLAGPTLGFWIHYSNFNISFLKSSFAFMIVLLLLLFMRHHSFAGVFDGLSENYISVIMICNTILIAGIEYKQYCNLSVWPAVCCLFLSVLSWGRAGILCSCLLLLLVLFSYWVKMSFKKKIVLLVFFLVVLLCIIIRSYDLIVDFVENAEVLSKFQERGLESPSRGILIDEYFSHINWKTFLLGYKFDNNPWFIHYGLNPHNSYIRLHYQIGIVAICFFIYALLILFRLLKRNLLLFAMVSVLLLRAFTDVYLFFGMYDFLFFFLLLFASKTKNESNEVLLSK